MGITNWGLFIAVFVACFVEAVEATTIVMAMGFTRGWKSALLGTGAALGVLSVITAFAGLALTRWLPESLLQLIIGGLLLIFGLQWLRKAILRSAGLKSQHNEEEVYREEVAAAKHKGKLTSGIDSFAFGVSFKGVLLEGMEVVFIVITFGLTAKNIPLSAISAVIGVLAVLVIAFLIREPLSMIPENLLKYGVGLLLTSFGTFWVVEGMGYFQSGQGSLSWPGDNLSVLGLLAAWFLLSQLYILLLKSLPLPASQELKNEVS